MSTGAPVGRSVILLAWALASLVAGLVVWSAVELIGGDRAGARASVLSESEVASLATQAMPGAGSSAAGSPQSNVGSSSVDATGARADSSAAGGPTPTPPLHAVTGAPDATPGGGASATAPAALPGATGSAVATGPATGSAPEQPALRPTAPATSAGSSGTQGVAVVARTWSTSGGQVGVRCTGARIDLLFATPRDGWTVQVSQAGPESVEVSFRGAGAQAATHAVCVHGTPVREADGAEADD